MKPNLKIVRKNLIGIAYIFSLVAFSGCQKDSTQTDPQLVVGDQVFSLVEKSPVGTKVGQVVASEQDRVNFFLVSSSYSPTFSLDSVSGELFVRDSVRIDFNLEQKIELEMLTCLTGTAMQYGTLSKITINIIDQKDLSFWTSANSDGINQDAVVNSLNPLVNNSSPEVYQINAWTVDLQASTSRSYLQFDLTAIPADAEVRAATLKLYNPNDGNNDHEQSCFSGSNAFYVRRVTSTWMDQTLTWNNQPTYTADGQVLLPASQTKNQDYTIDVTEIVREMVAHPDANFGFVMMLSNENYYRRVCFASMEYFREELRPVLEINYLY